MSAMFALAASVSAQNLPSTAVGPAATAAPVSAAEATGYELGPNDQITIQVSDAPDINGKSQRIDPNGDLRLPMVGRVHAGGMTIDQLERELTARFKAFINEPDVAVTVTEFKSQPVSIIGAVVGSGVHQLEGRKTLIEILSLAGGVTAEAGPVVRIVRRADQGALPIQGAVSDGTGAFTVGQIELRPLLNASSPETNIVIQPYDVISVPKAETVFVIGEVAKPGPIALSAKNSLSLVEALSAAGGALKTAASGHARLLRQPPDHSVREEIAVNLDDIMQGRTKDVQLISGDILIVPDSRGKRAATRALEAALQAGILISSYGLIR